MSEPLALASENEAHPVVVDRTDAAADHGVEVGMLVSRAMGCCGALQVYPCDAPQVERAAERFVRRLEALGAAVQPLEPGRVLLEAGPLALLYGGVEGVLGRLAAAFSGGDVRLGAGPNPFVAHVAARRAAPGAWLRVPDARVRELLDPMSLDVLPASRELVRLFHALGMETLADVGRIDVHQIADRFGAHGLLLHQLARGQDASEVQPRVSVEAVSEVLVFPEPVGNERTLESAAQMLAERLVTHPRCIEHAPRAVVASCVLAGGGAWQGRRVLRVPTVDPRKLALAIAPALAQIPSPIERLELALDGFEPRAGTQHSLLGGRGSAYAGGSLADEELHGIDDERVQRGMRHVQEALGEDALLQVLEIEPWSRVPERHAVLVPRRVAGADGEGG